MQNSCTLSVFNRQTAKQALNLAKASKVELAYNTLQFVLECPGQG